MAASRKRVGVLACWLLLAAMSAEAATTCPGAAAGQVASCPGPREDLLLQLQRSQRRAASKLNATGGDEDRRGGDRDDDDDYSGLGFCCLSPGGGCGECESRSASGAWCGKGRLACEYFCRGSWCDERPRPAAARERSTYVEPVAITRSRCCLAAEDEADTCGTCWPDSFAQPSSWCAQTEANCRSCAGGQGTWCSTTVDSPTAPPAAPPAESPVSGAGRCCFAASDSARACATCYPEALAGPGHWCAESEERCRTCSGSWCGAAAPPPSVPTISPPVTLPPRATTVTTTPEASSTTTRAAVEATTKAASATTTPEASTTGPSTTTEAPASTPPPSDSTWIKGTWTTGYWDCCKPSCSWPGKGNVDSPTLACDADTGERLFDANVRSVCDGGTAAACVDNAPFVVNRGLSMGFSAVAVSGNHGLSGDDNCGQCYELKFMDQIHFPDKWGGSHPDLVGKSMVVQVTNIGYDVNGEHSFDIQIPGAGQGIFTSGCTAQFPGYSSGDFDCDNNYGGCHEKSGCARLPRELQKPCEWRYDWYRWLVEKGQTNNPYVRFRRVRCPRELTDISGSVPLDDERFPVVDVSGYA